MNAMLNDIAHGKNSQVDAVRLNENQRGVLCKRGASGRGAVVLGNDSSEFGPAANLTFDRGHEVFVEYRVVAPHPSMGPVLVIMPEPSLYDVVQLVLAEAHEVMQTFAFQRPNESFEERVRHRGTWWNFDWPHSSLLPERVENIRILPVTIPNEKPGLDAFVFHPHRGVSSLLHYPLRIRMIG